jgi:hypothetical protein
MSTVIVLDELDFLLLNDGQGLLDYLSRLPDQPTIAHTNQPRRRRVRLSGQLLGVDGPFQKPFPFLCNRVVRGIYALDELGFSKSVASSGDVLAGIVDIRSDN